MPCQQEPLVKPMLDWNEITERTQQRYMHRTSDIVTSVLNAISAPNAAHLCMASSPNIKEHEQSVRPYLPSEKTYLDALAQAYKNVVSWVTRRQVLSMFSDVTSFCVVSEYIPELTS